MEAGTDVTVGMPPAGDAGVDEDITGGLAAMPGDGAPAFDATPDALDVVVTGTTGAIVTWLPVLLRVPDAVAPAWPATFD
jgi:hypothetical protein